MDRDLARALALAYARAEYGSRRPDVDDLLRAVLDDERSDAARLLAHLGLDPAGCRADPSEPKVAIEVAVKIAREVGDTVVRTDHLLAALLPAPDTVAVRAAIAERAAAPVVVPEPAGPPPKLPGQGALVGFYVLVLAVTLAVVAAMAALASPEMRPWLFGYALTLAAIGLVPRLFPIMTQQRVDRIMARLAGGHALLPISAPIIVDALLAAGMHRVETHLRDPGGKSPSKVVVHGRVTWIAFERAMLLITGAPFMVAYAATMAARRSMSRRQMASGFAYILVTTWPMGWLLTMETGHVAGSAVLPPVIGLLAAALLFFGTHWYETFAAIRTASDWAGLPATDAWFDHESYHRRAFRRVQKQRFMRVPFRLRQRVWAGPSGVHRVHDRWHETIGRAGGAARCERNKLCDGGYLLSYWLDPRLTLGELVRRLDAVGADPFAELAVWTHPVGPRAADILQRAGVRATP